jgi:hypothetical protein
MGSPPASPGKIKEVLERVDSAAAKVKALDAQVRAELEEEKREEGQKKRRNPKTEARMMSREAVERQKAHALAAWLDRKEDEDDDDDDDDDEPEPDAKKRKRAPKKDLLAMYGSHEKVLTHYMQLSNGFVVEDHGASEVRAVQLVVPKCGVEKMKSFRARFGRHLRALGFVPNTPEEAEKQAQLLKPEYLEHAKTFDSNVWVRPYAIESNRAFAQRRLDPHTLLEEKPPDAIDPALLEDPLADA